MEEYYKKIDKSFFTYGLTIPNKYINIFIRDEEIELGTSRKIKIIFKGKAYESKISNINRKKARNVYQIRWDSNYELLATLKKEFIQSYFAIVSQNYIAKKEKRYYVTNLLGGNQEVVIFKPISIDEIYMETFIRIETPYDNIFKEMVKQNVFGWLSTKSNQKIITKSSKWLDISEIKTYEDLIYVVYYLIDEQNKEIYIGSARRLGDRVKPKRIEIPEWNRFRYEIIHPKFHQNLREIEYHSIMNFARFFSNRGGLSSVKLSEYTLVNKDYKFYQKIGMSANNSFAYNIHLLYGYISGL